MSPSSVTVRIALAACGPAVAAAANNNNRNNVSLPRAGD